MQGCTWASIGMPDTSLIDRFAHFLDRHQWSGLYTKYLLALLSGDPLTDPDAELSRVDLGQLGSALLQVHVTVLCSS